MATTTTENPQAPSAEISTGSQIRAIAFTANGKYLVSGDKETVRMWRVADKQQVGMMNAKDVRSITISKDGKWIAAGKSWGETTVWEGETFKEVFTHDADGHTVTSVDFSPDSTKLVTASGNRRAYIVDVRAGGKVIRSHEHPYWVIAAKFSPQGDRIATATFRDSVRVYDSRNGIQLAVIEAKVTPYYNTGLLWSNAGALMILSNNSISRINLNAPLSPKSDPVSLVCSVDDSNYPCIVSPEPGEFLLYSVGYEIVFINPSQGTQNQGPIQLSQDAHSIALSRDGQFLAIGGGDGKLDIINMVTTGEQRTRHVTELAKSTGTRKGSVHALPTGSHS